MSPPGAPRFEARAGAPRVGPCVTEVQRAAASPHRRSPRGGGAAAGARREGPRGTEATTQGKASQKVAASRPRPGTAPDFGPVPALKSATAQQTPVAPPSRGQGIDAPPRVTDHIVAGRRLRDMFETPLQETPSGAAERPSGSSKVQTSTGQGRRSSEGPPPPAEAPAAAAAAAAGCPDLDLAGLVLPPTVFVPRPLGSGSTKAELQAQAIAQVVASEVMQLTAAWRGTLPDVANFLRITGEKATRACSAALLAPPPRERAAPGPLARRLALTAELQAVEARIESARRLDAAAEAEAAERAAEPQVAAAPGGEEAPAASVELEVAMQQVLVRRAREALEARERQHAKAGAAEASRARGAVWDIRATLKGIC